MTNKLFSVTDPPLETAAPIAPKMEVLEPPLRYRARLSILGLLARA